MHRPHRTCRWLRTGIPAPRPTQELPRLRWPAFRAATTLLRSALENTFKVGGYRERDLRASIDAAARDGLITAARRQHIHTDVRRLGNDIVHDEWRPVDQEEFELARTYVVWILEDLYADRLTVEAQLLAQGRLAPATVPEDDSESSEGATQESSGFDLTPHPAAWALPRWARGGSVAALPRLLRISSWALEDSNLRPQPCESDSGTRTGWFPTARDGLTRDDQGVSSDPKMANGSSCGAFCGARVCAH